MTLEPGFEFTGEHFRGNIRVLALDEAKNELIVDLTTGGGYSWVEEWMLDHTILGFENGEYFTR